MDRQFRRVARGVHVDIQNPSIGLFQLSFTVQFVGEELVPVLCDPRIDEYTVDAPEFGVAGGEAGALGGPGCNVAVVVEGVCCGMLEG